MHEDILKNKRTIFRRYSGGIVLLFALLIGVPMLGTFFRWDFYPPQTENRPMAEFPGFGKLPASEWPGKTEAWFQDHFGFRNTFIRRYNGIRRDWFALQPDSVVMNEKGWLFTTSDGAMADFMGLRILSDEELYGLQETFEGRQVWLEKKGIDYLLVIAPNKCVIYPEELPPELRAARGTDGVVQLMTFLDSRNSHLNRLDLRHVLLENKDQGVLYFSNDTHWTPMGSYFGYQEVIEAVQKQLPQIPDPVPFESCTLVPGRWTGDLISFVGDGKNRDIDYLDVNPPERLSAVLDILPGDQLPDAPEEVAELMIVHNPNGKGTAVVFHDSFGKYGWKKFFPLHFRETVFMLAARPPLHLFNDAIEKYRPDIIIEEQVQRMVLHKDQPKSRVWSQAFSSSNSGIRK